MSATRIILDIENNTTQEASLSLIKFLRLIRVRLITQGLKATLWWSFNVFNRLVLDQPIRRQCQVTPQLFVGAQFHRRGWRVLQHWGIIGVVNLRSEFDDLGLGVDIPAYLALPTRDDDAPTLENMERGAAFIRQQVEAGGKVYVHCGAGVGRAPTLAAAYLVTTGLSPEQAYEAIRKQRIFIRPTRVQREQLRRFAEQRGERDQSTSR
jgi:protein-tyrosine phosphatase